VYDYALVTEPLSGAQLSSLGWKDRRGAADLGNQFHYFRLTRDNRILWGGYDAVYFNGGRIHDEQASRPETFARLAAHFFATFPQLEGVSFTHAWGGIIDTCSRFCAFFGTAYRGRLAYAAGYTGLGVGATRFGAQVMLDMLEKSDTERTRLTLVRSKPLPFPPEPLRSAVVQLTRSSLARADRNDGRRDPWLRLLDRLGLGYDSQQGTGFGRGPPGIVGLPRLDLTRVPGAPSVLVAPGVRSAGRRDATRGATRKPSGATRVPRDPRHVGILEVRELPRASKVLRN
jgi:hypothetical protein